jgi:tRNA G10  N-methylase Trm11
MVKKVLGVKNFIPLIKSSLPPPKRRRFKIVFSLANQMISVDRGLVKKLEEKLCFIEDLKLSVKNPDLEFWFILRSEGIDFFGTRISYNYDKIKSKQKGKLKTELAHLLSFLSAPSPKDIILDPFAGYGAIPKERIHSFPYKFLIAVDQDKSLTLKLKNNLSKHRNIEILCANALNLKEIKDETMDKIITDPPWGEYQKIDNLVAFYIDMLKAFKRMLVNKGIAVILTGSVEKFEGAILQFKNFFEGQKKLKILVSRKKASIFKIIKKG